MSLERHPKKTHPVACFAFLLTFAAAVATFTVYAFFSAAPHIPAILG